MFELCFQGVTHLNFNDDEDGGGDRIFLDNIFFNALAKQPSNLPAASEQVIKHWYYPNPTSGFLKVGYEAESIATYELLILDSKGSLVSSFEQQAQEGTNDLLLDLRDLPGGLYLLKLRTGEKEVVFKVQKQ